MRRHFSSLYRHLVVDDVSEVNNREMRRFPSLHIRLSNEQIKDVRLSDRIHYCLFLSSNAPTHTHRHHSEDFQLIYQTIIMFVLLSFLLITRISRSINITDDLSDEQRLFHKIMSTYEKSVRPSRRASEPIVVKLGISLTQIMDIVSSTIDKTIITKIFRMNEIK